jgi:hypothetical protein
MSSNFLKFDAQIAANGISGSLYFKKVCMTTHTTMASPLMIIWELQHS